MNLVKTLIFENENNSENLHNIKALVKEIGESLSGKYKELESVEVERDGDVIFNWEGSLIDDYSVQDTIKEDFFTVFRQEAKSLHPELF